MNIVSENYSPVLRRYNLNFLYHFTHLNNLESILCNGLLPNDAVEQKSISFSSMANKDVKNRRRNKLATLKNLPDNFMTKRVTECVPLYINVKNPMLFVDIFVFGIPRNEIIHLRINTIKILEKFYCFFDGNAACDDSRYYTDFKDLDKMDWKAINSRYWNDFPGGKRKKCSEFLVFPEISISDIFQIVVFDEQTKIKVEGILDKYSCPIENKVIIDRNLYF